MTTHVTTANSGAHFEIKVEGVVRTHRDFRETAIEAARFLQQRNPGAKIEIRDLRDSSRSGSTVRHESARPAEQSQISVRDWHRYR